MKTFTVMLAFVLSLNVHATEIKPTWSSTYKIGDGTVIYFDPQVEIEGKDYYLAFSSMGWGTDTFTPTEYCRIVAGPQSQSNWYADLVMRPEGEFLMASFKADGTVIRAEKTTGWVTPQAVYCYDADPSATGEHIFLDIHKIKKNVAKITHESYVEIPYNAENNFYYGAPRMKNFGSQYRMYVYFDMEEAATSARSICKFAGYHDFISFEASQEVANIPNHGTVNIYEGEIDDFSFGRESLRKWSVTCTID